MQGAFYVEDSGRGRKGAGGFSLLYLLFLGPGGGNSGGKLDMRAGVAFPSASGRCPEQVGCWPMAGPLEEAAGKWGKAPLSSAAQAGGGSLGMDSGTDCLRSAGFLPAGAVRRLFPGLGDYLLYPGGGTAGTSGFSSVLFSADAFLSSGVGAACMVGTGRTAENPSAAYAGCGGFSGPGGGCGSILESAFPSPAEMMAGLPCAVMMAGLPRAEMMTGLPRAEMTAGLPRAEMTAGLPPAELSNAQNWRMHEVGECTELVNADWK